MSEIIFEIEEAPEGGYTARALGHAIFTEAESLDELRGNVRDAVRCHFDEGAKQRLKLTEELDDSKLAALVTACRHERRIKIKLNEL
jgi:hypothetical protein